MIEPDDMRFLLRFLVAAGFILGLFVATTIVVALRAVT